VWTDDDVLTAGLATIVGLSIVVAVWRARKFKRQQREEEHRRRARIRNLEES